jgi:3-phosphoshikimate 1-carboxyvinyltransferase
MRIWVRPGATIGGEAAVPGDKSIAHRWLILAACADGTSELADLPPSLDVVSTARCLATLVPGPRAELERWTERIRGPAEADGFTTNKAHPRGRPPSLRIRGTGWAALEGPGRPLDCGNSGTCLRLLAGVVSGSPFETVLTGDASLRRRPMERIARPLREMGADVRTTGGHPPVAVRGGALRGIEHRPEVPSAQVKGAVLLAGLRANGVTSVIEPAPTRDHTERALTELGAPVAVEGGRLSVSAFQAPGFSASVPGDVSSAAFLAAAAAVTGGHVVVANVGLNPTRTRFLEVLRRFGVRVDARPGGTELGEPVGELSVEPATELRGTLVAAEEVPLVIDEIPALAAIAAHAVGATRFERVAELRVKESDRLEGTARAIAGLGGRAEVEGEDLLIGGGGLEGGSATASLDHRMAMALVVAALGSRGPSRIDGIESAEVSFPGFVEVLSSLGARIEVEG